MLATANTTTAKTAASGLKQSTSLNQVESQQRAAAARFKERTAEAEASAQKMGEVRAEWQKALETGDVDKLSILNATFETASRDNAKNTKDLSGMMSALLEGYKDIGLVIKSAEELNAAEQGLIDTANKLVTDKQGELVQAQGLQWNILGRRDKAIAAANAAIKTAQDAVKTATQTAEAMRRERLGNMNMEASMQLQQGITQELIDVAMQRIDQIETDLASVQTNANETMDAIESDTKKTEELDASLVQLNGELSTLQEELGLYTENSSEWQECRARIMKKTRERDDTEAERNAAFTRAQEGQRFIEFNKMEEQGQIQLLAQHKTWISLLQMGTKQRDTLYQVHLNLVKGATEQQAMSMIDQVAIATDERMAMDAAQKTQAMRKQITDRVKGMPDQVRRMREIVSTETANQAAFEDMMNAEISNFHKNFGTDVGYDNRDAQRQAQSAA